MNDSGPTPRSASSKKIAIAWVALGIVIASVGGATILSLRAERTPSRFLVGPDVPLESGDRVRARIGSIECATEVLAVSGADVVVAGCGGAPPVSVPRGGLSMDAYRARVLEPNVGDQVLVLDGGRFVRSVVVGLAGEGRIRVSVQGGGVAPAVERTIEARAAFVLRSSVPR